MAVGWSTRQIVIVLYLLTILLSLVALATAQFD
jgi:UDP-N-acetylmuramyl pentapeptide phosphotransferase/UDP-N-acetylglucosamine-1-phosphate transferase